LKKILIVDDDEELLEYLKEAVELENINVTCTDDPYNALELINSSNYDLVLLDYMMPDMDGIDLCSKIRGKAPGIKIILMTAFATVDNAVKAMKKGADDYISKPFKINELINILKINLEKLEFSKCFHNSEMDEVFGVLSNSIRRKIMFILKEAGSMKFMDINKKLGIEDHTKTNFHLKQLRKTKFIEQSPEKTYSLTTKGKRFLSCIESFSK